MDTLKVKKYWLKESEESLNVAKHLFEKKDYFYSLFFGHLAIEKVLKAIYVVRKGEQAPYIHNLNRLSELADIQLTEEEKITLNRITSFNIEGRYPDEKRSFRKKCTKDFTQRELDKIKEVFKWLKSMT